MDLTCQSCTSKHVKDSLAKHSLEKKFVVALAGNPNTGKSTVFNALTGLNQHTGNWAGKTVTNAKGTFRYHKQEFTLVDLPGTYSLLANSADEEAARDFLCVARPDVTIAIADATCLERNLNLILQILELTDKVVLGVNLMDEAKDKGILVDIPSLSLELGIPVIPMVARDGKGLTELLETVYLLAKDQLITTPYQITYDEEIEKAISHVIAQLSPTITSQINPRWLALRILEGEEELINNLFKETTPERLVAI